FCCQLCRSRCIPMTRERDPVWHKNRGRRSRRPRHISTVTGQRTDGLFTTTADGSFDSLRIQDGTHEVRHPLQSGIDQSAVLIPTVFGLSFRIGRRDDFVRHGTSPEYPCLLTVVSIDSNSLMSRNRKPMRNYPLSRRPAA